MEEEVTETEYCSNCRRDIPAANYVMHVTHCQRNLTLCKVCGEPVPTLQQEEHFEENHAKVKCDCGQHVEKMNLEEHKEKDCTSRLVECQFCELEVAFSELKSHVEYCGSRTEKCDICDRYIQKKDLEAHMDTGCQYPVKEEKKPMPSKRPNDFFSEMPVGMLHAMGLMDSSERNPNMENFFPQLVSGMREFGQILNTGLGTPPFNGASYFGDVDAGDTAFDDRDVVARGVRGVWKPGFDQQTSQDSEQVDIDYTHQSDYDDDEMLAATYQAEGFDSTNGTSGTLYEPVSEASSDATQLPCEFCGKLLAMDMLILHQSGCQLRSLDSYPSSGSADVYFDGSRMYNLPQPNNSADMVHEEFHELETEDNKDNHDVTFLPCEFCQELLPFDNLIAHQSVCDAGPPSIAPSVLHNGSTPAPLNNTRPTVRNASQSRPSRPVYESRKIQKPIQNFIPSELDDFGPDSLDATTSENGRKPDRGNNGFDVVNGAALNNEVPRTGDDHALHGQSVLRNNDGSAINNKLSRKTRDDRGLRGQSVLRNNDLDNREPSKDIPRVKNRTSDQPAKRPLEPRGGVTGTSYKGPTVKPKEDGMGPKKRNTGARSKPACVPQTSDSNRSTKPNQSSVNEAPERNKRDSAAKSTAQTHKFDARSSRPRRTGTDGDNSDYASAMRSNPPRPSKTQVQDSLPSGTNPRRNPPTFNLGDRLDRGKARRQETTSESQSSSTQASASPRKSSIKKKVV